jgi:hypothetical protein
MNVGPGARDLNMPLAVLPTTPADAPAAAPLPAPPYTAPTAAPVQAPAAPVFAACAGDEIREIYRRIVTDTAIHTPVANTRHSPRQHHTHLPDHPCLHLTAADYMLQGSCHTHLPRRLRQYPPGSNCTPR